MTKISKYSIFSLVLATFFILNSSIASAGECFSQPVVAQDWYGVTNSAVNLRNVACMEGSNVIVTLSAGEEVQVVNNDDGWLEVVRTDGSRGWLWGEFVTATAAPTPVQTSQNTYSPLYDISGHKYEDAIRYIYNLGIVQGYQDGAYLPENTLRRDELLKIVIEAKYSNEFDSFANENCFADVSPSDWSNKYVCFAKSKGIVEGFEGNNFRPGQQIIMVEALKIALETFDYQILETSSPWYKSYVNEAATRNFIPTDFNSATQNMTRGQMADLITRMIKYNEGILPEYLGGEQNKVVTFQTLEQNRGPLDLKSGECIDIATCLNSSIQLYVNQLPNLNSSEPFQDFEVFSKQGVAKNYARDGVSEDVFVFLNNNHYQSLSDDDYLVFYLRRLTVSECSLSIAGCSEGADPANESWYGPFINKKSGLNL